MALLSTIFLPLFPFIYSSYLDHSFSTLHCGCGVTSCSGRGQLHGEGKILTLKLFTYREQEGQFEPRYKISSLISFVAHYYLPSLSVLQIETGSSTITVSHILQMCNFRLNFKRHAY